MLRILVILEKLKVFKFMVGGIVDEGEFFEVVDFGLVFFCFDFGLLFIVNLSFKVRNDLI